MIPSLPNAVTEYTAAVERLMTIAEYAEWCDIDPKYVEGWLDEGMPVHRQDGIRYIRRADVTKFLAPKLANIHDDQSHGTHADDAPSGEHVDVESILVAEEYMGHGFFG